MIYFHTVENIEIIVACNHTQMYRFMYEFGAGFNKTVSMLRYFTVLEINDDTLKSLCAREDNGSYVRSMDRLFTNKVNNTAELKETLQVIYNNVRFAGVYSMEWDTAQIKCTPFRTTINQIGTIKTPTRLL